MKDGRKILIIETFVNLKKIAQYINDQKLIFDKIIVSSDIINNKKDLDLIKYLFPDVQKFEIGNIYKWSKPIIKK